ncbi:MAG: SPFH domain-containing protein [Planctomycetota bacterium]
MDHSRPNGPAFPPHRRPRKNVEIEPRHIATGLIGFLILSILLGALVTGWTYVEPGEVAVVKNNLFGSKPEVILTSGLIIHLPFGMTDVFKLDKRVQVFSMTKNPRRGDRAGNDNVRIKVADGSNVEADVEVNYRIIPEMADIIVRKIGPGNSFKKKLLRSYTRAIIREMYGVLTLETVSDPSSRTGQNTLVLNRLNENLEEFGLKATLVNTTNFVFNIEYNRLVKEKKGSAQEFLNQAAAQEQARKEQETEVASATRQKNVSLIEAQGHAKKRMVEADNRAKQLRLRAKGESYAKRKEGDRNFAVATNDAAAIEAEGLNNAAGIMKLAQAYREGGLGLVKEAIATKLRGTRINGRPYSLSEKIERIQVDRSAVPAATTGVIMGGDKK